VLLEAYESGLVSSFLQILTGSDKPSTSMIRLSDRVLVDCSNGVGTFFMQKLQMKLQDTVALELCNDSTDHPEALNFKCGADFVQKEQSDPFGTHSMDFIEGRHLVSLDGDADRVVYFITNHERQQQSFSLLDGDYIIALFCMFIRRQLDQLPSLSTADVTVGVVQTAYANGASTEYLVNTLHLTVECVATGVKHLHHRAKNFDIGVYFEANGHGTVLFSGAFLSQLHKLQKMDNTTHEQHLALMRLLAMSKLLHPTVGDAIADMLMVEACLYCNQWNIANWQCMYRQRPSRQQKVTVKNPQLIKTVPDETRAVAPEGLQQQIDEFVRKYDSSRAFVRPSGTEPVVRIYSEAASQEQADNLAADIQHVLLQILQ
jgi:phosphoacetylglucosamine mutase